MVNRRGKLLLRKYSSTAYRCWARGAGEKQRKGGQARSWGARTLLAPLVGPSQHGAVKGRDMQEFVTSFGVLCKRIVLQPLENRVRIEKPTLLQRLTVDVNALGPE